MSYALADGPSLTNGGGLLFDAELTPLIRERARRREGLIENVRARCDSIVRSSAEFDGLDDLSVRYDSHIHAQEAADVAEGYLLTSEPAYADWAKRRVDALLLRDSWKFPWHHTCLYMDHCIANVAAHIAMVHDYLGACYTAQESAQLASDLRRPFFDLCLSAIRGRVEWWSKAGLESNWKIMCFGESGLAICEFANYWPEAAEALSECVAGVCEILDMVPPEGDWPEGVGYWFGTLHMGLRFATALRRLTDGSADLYQHPALKATGDFPAMLSTPSATTYGFADNGTQLGRREIEALLLLARENNRPDWLACARWFPIDSPLGLALDDPDIASEHPRRKSFRFPRTGVGTVRAGWQKDDMFVGVKCGPSDVGHGHLDAASFVIQAAGQTLLRDEGFWPYSAQLDFFDFDGPRWDFDGASTIGHNTLLVDGQGQVWGKDYPGCIVRVEEEDGFGMIECDASKTYGTRLKKFIRTVVALWPDVVVVRDVVECAGTPGRIEWLMHHAGTAWSEGDTTFIENAGVRMSCVPFLPEKSSGWRVTDAVRTSCYPGSDSLATEVQSVKYRSFSPFPASERFEFLFGFRVGGGLAADDWRFNLAGSGSQDDCPAEHTSGLRTFSAWELSANGYQPVIVPSGDSLAVLDGGAS